MGDPTTLAAVIAGCLEPLAARRPLTPRQWQVCHHLRACRTEAMGGALLRCAACGAEQPLYRSCRDRHCPRCQWRETQRWCERQRAAVLPVTYHHLVFTLPDVLNGWVEVHPREVYAVLFETVWATLSAFARNRLAGQLGMTAVLHTWGQTLTRHVHLHCLVPGGALGADGAWQGVTTRGLFPVRALSRHVRGGFVARLRARYKAGGLPRLRDAREVDRVLDALMAREWVVFSKPCLARTETVVDYLGRYTHRIALSDRRLSDFDGQRVTLAYKDYADGDRNKTLVLSGEELIRRFLLHVLPHGFMRVRHFGFLANRCRAARLAQIRQALAVPQPPGEGEGKGEADRAHEHAPDPAPWICRQCGTGHLGRVGVIPARGLTKIAVPRRDGG